MNIVIFGSGALAELAHYYFTHDSSYTVVGFCLDRDYIRTETLFGLPVVPFDTVENVFDPENHALFVAVGYTQLNSVRAKKCTEAKEKGYTLATYISSSAINWSAKVGENCFVLENVVLQPFIKLGKGSIIWAGAVLSHHSVIGDYCYVSPSTTISGSVRMGDYCFLGANSTIKDQVTIASKVIVGMGSIVTRDLLRSGVYKGSPAKFSTADTLI